MGRRDSERGRVGLAKVSRSMDKDSKERALSLKFTKKALYEQLKKHATADFAAGKISKDDYKALMQNTVEKAMSTGRFSEAADGSINCSHCSSSVAKCTCLTGILDTTRLCMPV